MTFALPLYLPWIAAALLPWILHLFLFRKAEDIRFPSLFFLKQCYGWSNRLKLKKLLLLLTRSALILYFIIAILEPYVRKSSSAAGTAAQSGPVILVLDDRPAMRMKLMARNDSLFDAYRQAVLDDLDRRPLGTEVAAVPLSELAVPASIRFVSPRQAAGNIQMSAVQTLEPAVEYNLKLALDRFPGKLLFFSPFQLNLRDPKLERVGPVPACEPNLTLFSLKSPLNVSLARPLSVQATVVDLRGRPAESMVRLKMDDREVAVASAEQGVASFLLTSLTPGRRLLTAELVNTGADGYPEDDQRTIQIDVTPDPTVGFAANRIPRAMAAALNAFGQPVGSASPTPQVPMSRISASGASSVGVSDSDPTSAGSSPASRKMETQDWETRQRIVALNLQSQDIGLIQKALARGAEIVVFSDAIDQGEGASQLAAFLKMETARDEKITAIDANLLRQAWNTGSVMQRSDLSSENRFIPIVRKIKIIPLPRDSVLAQFTDGTPAVLRRTVGHGTVTVVAFSAADPVLQADPAFLLMVQELLSTDRPKSDMTWSAGDAFIFADIPLRSSAAVTIGPAAPAGAVRLMGKSASAHLPLGYSQGRFFAEIPSPAPPPGLYRLLIGDEEKGMVHLYPAPPPPLALPERIDGMRVRIGFGPFFFWIAVLLMAVELLLLRQMRSVGTARAS